MKNVTVLFNLPSGSPKLSSTTMWWHFFKVPFSNLEKTGRRLINQRAEPSSFLPEGYIANSKRLAYNAGSNLQHKRIR
jgi:hypothetical protein